MSKPFSTYPEDRGLLMTLARTVQASNDAEVVDQAAGKLSDLVLAILSDEATDAFDHDQEPTTQVIPQDAATALRDAYTVMAFAFNRLSSSARSRDGELCSDLGKVRGKIEQVFRNAGEKL
ncbi:MAG: hypothetical protein BGO05_10140 [Rhizobiales bacterium 63-7]|nr:hypothetical protein [Hyphomicrobiales bacterium]OJU66197.1 MAG: hypothetical protein BGO05_10140 [Rhizobiales bacterium 63-7]